MFVSRDNTAGQNHNIKVDNKSFASVANFKYLGIMAVKQYYTHITRKSRNSWNFGTIMFRAFCLPCYNLKMQRLKHTKCKFTCHFMWV